MKIKFYHSFILNAKVMVLAICAGLVTFFAEAQTLTVDAVTDTDFTIGQELEITFTTSGFDAGTQYAVVLTQNSASVTLGKGASSPISVTMPLSLPLDESCPGCSYEISVVPYVPNSPGGDLLEFESYYLDDEDYWESIEGGYIYYYSDFYFYEVGQRMAETVPMDFTQSDSVYIWFEFYGSVYGDTSVSEKLVPRVEVTTNGTTYVPVALEHAVYYEEGYLYDNGYYYVKLPTSSLSATTQIRWSQPLNGGWYNDTWEIYDIGIDNYQGNEVDSYSASGTPFGITLGAPDLGTYTWRIADSEDVIFSGESFTYSWDTVGVSDAFPAGTVFTFTIDEEDPGTGEAVIIGTTSSLGNLTAETPAYLPNGYHDVYMTATLTVGGEEYVFYDEVYVGNFRSFIRVIKTTYEDNDPNDILYAGNSATFAIELENEGDDALDVSQLYATLVVDYDGDELIVATQQGIADITVALPPFLADGSYYFSTYLSEDEPLGDVGAFVEDDPLGNIEEGYAGDGDGPANFLNAKANASVTNVGSYDEYFTGNQIALNAANGRRSLTTRDFSASELEETTLFSYELYFDQLPENLTEDQYLTFEYSTDGGVTYTELASYPDTDADEIIDYDTYVFVVTSEMKTSGVRFRWRQEESKGTIILDDVSFTEGETMPFDYIKTYVDITDQALMISSIESETVCFGDEIVLNYEIRGNFGNENNLTIYYQYANGSSYLVDGYEFNVEEGSGSISFVMPSGVLEQGENNERFSFYLRAYNEQYNSYYGTDIDVYSTPSDQSVELVAPIDQDAYFYFDDVTSCDNTEDVIIYLDDVQEYFMYQVIDTETDEVLGSLTYSEENDYSTEVNIGTIDETTELGLLITSMASDGTECSTIRSTYTDVLEILPDYEMLMYNTALGTYLPISSGDTITICEYNEDVVFTVARILDDGSYSYYGYVNWYKDDLNTPVYYYSYLYAEDFSESGSYFAKVIDGNCTYLTTSIYVMVVEQPEMPAVTVVSGDLNGCEGADPVVLSAPAGYTYYSWSNGATTQTISVETTGSYAVVVSDYPFDTEGVCSSDESTPVVITRYNMPEFDMSSTGNLLTGKIGEADAFTGCESFYVYFHMDQGTSYSLDSDLTVNIYLNGVMYSSTQNSYYELEESGTYSFELINEDLNSDCSATSVSFDITIADEPTDIPLLTATGDLFYCEDESTVVLTAPSGFTYYRWYRNGSSISETSEGFEATSNVIEVTKGGNYSVAVGNAAGCFSPVSNAVEITTKALPTLPSYNGQTDATCGPGSVTFQFYSYGNYSYQLINALTGEASGSAVTVPVGTFSISSGELSGETPFYIEVSYLDGSGCVNYNEFNTFTGYVNNVSLELSGAHLEAVISSYSGYSEIRWYRNGVEMVNKINSDYIMVTDAAEYTVEVDFEGAGGLCTVSSNAIELTTEEPAEEGESSGRIVASAYPNPSVGNYVSVELAGSNFGTYQVYIMTLSGQVLVTTELEKNATDFSEKISTRNLQPGIYNMQIVKGKQIENIRIVKN